ARISASLSAMSRRPLGVCAFACCCGGMVDKIMSNCALVIFSSPTVSTAASGGNLEGAGIVAGVFGASVDGGCGLTAPFCAGGGVCCPHASAAPSRKKENLILLE